MKYAILDFGKVICYPTTGEWFITPYLEEFIKEHNLNRQDILDSISKFGYILDRKYDSMEDEVIMFHDFYKGIFDLLGYNIDEKDIEYIANDITYSTKKYSLYDGIRQELKRLKENYKLILLTDNWPCGEYLMNIWGLDEYFEKMYISSYYGLKKDNQEFFKLPMKEFNLKVEDIVFVDDSDIPLNTASSLGLKVYKMDRTKTIKNDKYPVINNLDEIK